MAKRLTPGEPLPAIPANDWNSFIATAERVAAKGPTTVPKRTRTPTRLYCWIQNKTAANLAADFPIVARGEPLYKPAQRAGVAYEFPTYEGDLPTANTSAGALAVVLGPGRVNDLRLAVATGEVWCDVDVTDATHTHALPLAGDSAKLASAFDTAGAPIRYKPAGTGLKRCLVELPGPRCFVLVRALVKGTATAGGAYTVDNVSPLAGGLSPVVAAADELPATKALADYVDDQEVILAHDSATGDWITVAPGGDGVGGSTHTHAVGCGLSQGFAGGVYTTFVDETALAGCGLQPGAGTCDLDVKPDPAGCLYCDAAGVGVQLAPGGCIACFEDGLDVFINPAGCLRCDSVAGLEVLVAPGAGITCGGTGLAINDPYIQAIIVAYLPNIIAAAGCLSASGDVLSVVVDPSGCLECTPTGLAVDVDGTAGCLECGIDGLKVKVKSGGGLNCTGDGLEIAWTCVEKTIVTNVACVDGEIVQTKETVRLIVCPDPPP